jgi:hypothetical protein
MNFYVDHYNHFDIQIRSVYTSYCGLICIFFPLFNLLYVSIDGQMNMKTMKLSIHLTVIILTCIESYFKLHFLR